MKARAAGPLQYWLGEVLNASFGDGGSRWGLPPSLLRSYGGQDGGTDFAAVTWLACQDEARPKGERSRNFMRKSNDCTRRQGPTRNDINPPVKVAHLPAQFRSGIRGFFKELGT